MKKSGGKYELNDFIDTHVHTEPDIRPRKLTDLDTAIMARDKGMAALVIKSHFNPTAQRARIASEITNFNVFGGITLNKKQDFSPCILRSIAKQGGKIVWMPTINHNEVLEDDIIEPVLGLIKDYNMIMATGHLNPLKILDLLDQARSHRISRIIINHPLTRVVGATIDEQKEMSKYAYLEHCYVACMPQHDSLSPTCIAEAINEVGPRHCIMATDFGQVHNPTPVKGMKMFIQDMMEHGISLKSIRTMCCDNPHDLLF
jgi:hypothetical protein